MSEAVVVWRLCAKHRLRSALTGEGPSRHGGRWNLPGTRIAYCAESRSLAALEVMVQVEDTAAFRAIEWLAIAIELPEPLLLRPPRHPPGWNKLPYSGATQRYGSQWAKSRRSVALRVPSAVVSGEHNTLLNPAHPDFDQLKIYRPVRFHFESLG